MAREAAEQMWNAKLPQVQGPSKGGLGQCPGLQPGRSLHSAVGGTCTTTAGGAHTDWVTSALGVCLATGQSGTEFGWTFAVDGMGPHLGV